jgi:hypothetical protein
MSGWWPPLWQLRSIRAVSCATRECDTRLCLTHNGWQQYPPSWARD